MLYVSDKISDDLIEVTDSYEDKGKLISVKDALALGTKVYGLHSNDTITVYSSVQKFLDMYRMRQALCNSPVSYGIDYDIYLGLGLITMYSCTLSDSVIHDLVIPDFIDFIDGHVFEKKLNLRSVVIPSSVRSVGYGCFRGCKNLESVVIDGISDLDIGNSVFESCERLRDIHLREGIRIISKSCFEGCTCLHELQLPDSLVQIGDSAFQFSGLETIKIPDSVKVVGGSAFTRCARLRYAYISDAVQTIQSYCFSGCINLEEVHLPKGLKKIAEYAFKRTNLKELWLPDTVEFVGLSDFTSPEKLLSRLRISKALLLKKQYAVFNHWYVDTVYLPEGLEELDLNYILGWHFKVIRFSKSVKLRNASVLCSRRINQNVYLYGISDSIDRVEVYDGSDAHIKLSMLEELRDKLKIIK